MPLEKNNSHYWIKRIFWKYSSIKKDQHNQLKINIYFFNFCWCVPWSTYICYTPTLSLLDTAQSLQQIFADFFAKSQTHDGSICNLQFNRERRLLLFLRCAKIGLICTVIQYTVPFGSSFSHWFIFLIILLLKI